jgi:hypothetical protein
MKFRMKKPRTGLSLTTTLAIAFFFLSAVALLVSSGLQIATNIEAQQKIITSEQQLIAQDATQTVRSFIQEKFSLLETSVGLADPVSASHKSRNVFWIACWVLSRPFGNWLC